MKFYTADELAELLQVSKRTVYRLMESGKLTGAKIGRVWRVSQIDLEKYLDRKQTA